MLDHDARHREVRREAREDIPDGLVSPAGGPEGDDIEGAATLWRSRVSEVVTFLLRRPGATPG
jgi:hypothetical protein